jgi:hypothetical protein
MAPKKDTNKDIKENDKEDAKEDAKEDTQKDTKKDAKNHPENDPKKAHKKLKPAASSSTGDQQPLSGNQLENFPAVDITIPLFAETDDYWKRKLLAKALRDRLMQYGPLKRSEVPSTKPKMLIAIKQIHCSKKEKHKWTKEEFVGDKDGVFGLKFRQNKAATKSANKRKESVKLENLPETPRPSEQKDTEPAEESQNAGRSKPANKLGEKNPTKTFKQPEETEEAKDSSKMSGSRKRKTSEPMEGPENVETSKQIDEQENEKPPKKPRQDETKESDGPKLSKDSKKEEKSDLLIKRLGKGKSEQEKDSKKSTSPQGDSSRASPKFPNSSGISLGDNDGASRKEVDETELNLVPDLQDNSVRTDLDEVLMKALQDFLYRSLDRHRSSVPKYSHGWAEVTDKKTLVNAFEARFPVEKMRIRMLFSINGENNYYWEITSANPKINSQVKSFQLVGRGPVWKTNSCAIDCCLVAGLMLDAGATVADASGGNYARWYNKLSDLSREFIRTSNAAWINMDDRSIHKLRDHFWTSLNQHMIRIGKHSSDASDMWKIGNMVPAVSIWQECTKSFGQFEYKHRRTTTCAACGSSSSVSLLTLSSDVSLADGSKDATMQELLARQFGKTKAKARLCCNRSERYHETVVVGDLPLRLVVIPPRLIQDQKSTQVGSVKNHTSQAVKFQYRTTLGYKEASYRWLGGIYFYSGHFRIYWTNRSRSQPDDGTFCVYDGMRADGAIVGGIMFEGSDPDERINAPSGTQGQTILFYERNLEPQNCGVKISTEPNAVAQSKLIPDDQTDHMREPQMELIPENQAGPIQCAQPDLVPDAQAKHVSRADPLLSRLTTIHKDQEVS